MYALLEPHRQTRPCFQGGQITIPGEHISAVNEATAHFTATVTDPKAQIITTYSVVAGQVDKTRDTLTPVEGLLMTRFPPQATVSQL